MAIQHASIADADRHEAKGASSATAKTVCTANGTGGTSFQFVSYNDLTDTPTSTAWAASVSSFSTSASQLPSALSTALQVAFGSTVTTTDVTINNLGVVTFNTAGQYVVKLKLNFSRTTASGIALLLSRALLNGGQLGVTSGVTLDNNLSNQYVEQTFLVTAAIGDDLTFEIVRDSGGINNGGLYKVTSATAGWSDLPSAAVEVYKFGG